jgi:hypothetical protein
LVMYPGILYLNQITAHSIYIPEKDVISLFYTRCPAPDAIENCPWLIITSGLTRLGCSFLSSPRTCKKTVSFL